MLAAGAQAAAAAQQPGQRPRVARKLSTKHESRLASHAERRRAKRAAADAAFLAGAAPSAAAKKERIAARAAAQDEALSALFAKVDTLHRKFTQASVDESMAILRASATKALW